MSWQAQRTSRRDLHHRRVDRHPVMGCQRIAEMAEYGGDILARKCVETKAGRQVAARCAPRSRAPARSQGVRGTVITANSNCSRASATLLRATASSNNTLSNFSRSPLPGGRDANRKVPTTSHAGLPCASVEGNRSPRWRTPRSPCHAGSKPYPAAPRSREAPGPDCDHPPKAYARHSCELPGRHHSETSRRCLSVWTA
jgi:hypothetical protein